jgi:uncharacterized membrane protein YfcA
LEDTVTLVYLILGLITLGAFSGLFAGLFGIGGGILIVPVLYAMGEVIGVAESVRMHVAVGTSLAVIVVTSVSSAIAHRRLGAIDGNILKLYGPGVLIGVLVGAGMAALVPGTVLTMVFAGIALAVAINMATGEPRRKLGTVPPGAASMVGLGTLTGVISTMSGIGGGAMTVAIMTLYSVPIHIAIGTSSAVGVIVSVPGALGFLAIGWNAADLPPLTIGYVNLVGFAVIAPVTVFTAPLGARLAHRLPRKLLAIGFALFLCGAALRMIWKLVAGGA